MFFDYDFVIVGSGFGGSVSALRLAEKGYSVCVIEKGKRFKDSDFPKTNWNVKRFLWLPFLRCFGIQNMSLFKDVLILSGTGVGGGSLVYANTLLQPSDEFYRAPIWNEIADWRTELEPHYATAKKMLGVTRNPKRTSADDLLLECAKDMGKGDTFRFTDVGIFFGEPGKLVDDPFFNGEGPKRQGCIYCGGCMIGCRHNAKNTLVKNYLYLAEKRGVKVIAERKVSNLRQIGENTKDRGFELETISSMNWFFKDRKVIRAKNVVLSGGVLGTMELMFKCKTITRTLPKISDRLGHDVRTNSEAIVGVTELWPNKKHDYSEGIAITSIFDADKNTSIEPVRYPKGSGFMRLLAAPMVDGGISWMRPLKVLALLLLRPLTTLRLIFNREWAQSSIILLVMQNLDNRIRFRLGRSLFTLFRKRLVTDVEEGATKAPDFIPIANEVGRAFAKKVGGIPQSSVNEVVLNIPMTAHILGGCGVGASPETGVIDKNHQVFGYPGLYVCDGSVIPANLGVNPSLTITAMTERAMSKIPAK